MYACERDSEREWVGVWVEVGEKEEEGEGSLSWANIKFQLCVG